MTVDDSHSWARGRLALKNFVALCALLTIVSCLTGCGARDAPADLPTRTAANGDRYNDVDVQFASTMLQHHAQALAMVDRPVRRDLDPEVQRLAEEIRETQGVEIERMTDWLTAWGQPIPETVRDHANADGGGSLASGTSGTISAEDVADLESAANAEFQELWLEVMIKHHQGAIDMTEKERSDGTFDPAVELADTIASAQQEEISTMQSLLGSRPCGPAGSPA